MPIKKVKNFDGEFIINYEVLNPQIEKSIVFLHGWGSNKEIMKQSFGKVFQDFKHIYIDMPGFGKSPTGKILKTTDYKEIIEKFLKEISVVPDAIFGHSFGGKVATLLAPKNLVLLSSSGILEAKPLKVKAKIALFKLLKPFGSPTCLQLAVR
ncbi:MAG: alpha/beta hydrolase [Campylobacterales bacterium]|nr:alpha/beta hydrolase [Campylobacterales bacterium]